MFALMFAVSIFCRLYPGVLYNYLVNERVEARSTFGLRSILSDSWAWILVDITWKNPKLESRHL